MCDDQVTEIRRLLEAWDEARKTLPIVEHAEPQPYVIPEDDDDDDEDGEDDWYTVYQKAVQTEQRVLNEEEGFAQLVSGNSRITKGPIKYQTNPVHFASVGPDQEGEDGHVRVSDNFTAGPELEALDDVKKHIEALERKLHYVESLKRSHRNKISKELDSLRKRLHDLSDRVQSCPATDVA